MREGKIMNFLNEVLELHKVNKGKIEINPKVSLDTAYDLSLAYSPGVAEPCLEIYKQKEKVYDYTMKGNMVAVVTDGSAVLGLGDIGPEAALPVMEGKAALFKRFAEVDAFPICLATNDVDEIVRTVMLLEPAFGGVNLEDIAAPNCFIIEERLKKELNIPVFHDDQHGTAIVTVAGLINALKLVGKSFSNIKIVVNGAGAAGISIAKLLCNFGIEDIVICDSKGAIFEGRPYGMNKMKEHIARITNKDKKEGVLENIIKSADVFIGVSVGGALTKDMVTTMNDDAIVFAMANPSPEIMPSEAIEAGAKVVGTGRSDYPNQINNVLAFPGIFRGALDVRATTINKKMEIAAAIAIAALITDKKIHSEYIIPNPFDERVAKQVAKAVSEAAVESGVASVVEN